MVKRWYSIHVLSNFEKKVASTIEEHASREPSLGDAIEQVFVPTEDFVEVRRGRKVNHTRRFMPGYVLVKADMTDEVYHFVRNLPRVSGFLGGAKGLPTPMSDDEVESLISRLETGQKSLREQDVMYEVGEQVKVVDGPFGGFVGVVEHADAERLRMKVAVSIFGRSTPVDLDYNQVHKV